MTTQQQFLDMLTEIEPSNSTVASCSSAHRTLRDALADHEEFGDVHVETFLSGSYIRDTAPNLKTACLHQGTVGIRHDTWAPPQRSVRHLTPRLGEWAVPANSVARLVGRRVKSARLCCSRGMAHGSLESKLLGLLGGADVDFPPGVE